MEPAADDGIVNLASNHSVDETVERLKIIHSREGRHAILDHRPQRRGGKGGNDNAAYQIINLGNPKSGTR
jgi:uncharacterized protein (DUF302 family)